MRLRKVISGGQTGADQQGLIEGRALGLETGGWVPRGWRTEDGSAPWLATFGCKEHPSGKYPPRTRENVKDSEATLWFGNSNSPGYYCTWGAAKSLGREFIVNPDADYVRAIADTFEVINIAGNRASTNPDVAGLVKAAFAVLK
jgi:hypothetical protein